MLHDVLLSYAFYNFDLSYCQAPPPPPPPPPFFPGPRPSFTDWVGARPVPRQRRAPSSHRPLPTARRCGLRRG